MIGETISRYRVIEKLGEGGMGFVYLAVDESLERRVALKFLKDEIVRIPAFRHQVMSEARAVAAVDHPFVCKVYEASETAERPFIALEYITGQTLKERLAEGPLPIEVALKCASEIAEALIEVHARGILHHDIKPGNIMLTQHGHVKLMDFGLAQKLRDLNAPAKPADALSTIVDEARSPNFGTPAYAAPEQLRGETLDWRTDIFSLGVVLYEMATGKHPFLKDSIMATVCAILYEDFPPLTTSRLADRLSAAITGSLRKNPEDRFQSMEDLRASLQQSLDTARIGPQGRPVQTVAVLPFMDLSPQKDQTYFCDGLAEELLVTLAQVEGMRVISRTSSFRFRSSGLEITDIGRTLNATAILDGSVRKGTGQIRITATLTNVKDGFQLWSQRYDCRPDDVIATQETIAQAIAENLKTSFAPSKAHVSISPEAHELYLRGLFYWNQRTPESLRESVVHYQKAAAIDPYYPRPHAGLAVAYVTLAIYGVMSPGEAMTNARKAAEEALKRGGRQADVLAALGCIASVYDWNWTQAESYFKEAIALDPRNALVRQWYAINLLAPVGRFDEATEQLEQARQIDPASPIAHATAGLNHYFERRYARAFDYLAKALELDPALGITHYFMAQIYLAREQPEKAIEELETADRLSNRDSESLALLGYAQAVVGNPDVAAGLLAELGTRARQGYLSPVLLAQVRLGQGNYDRAFELLEDAYKLKSTDLIWLAVRPSFDAIRDDPRFSNLTTRLGFPQ